MLDEKQARERLAMANGFWFEGSDLGISIRFNNRDEGAPIRWIIVDNVNHPDCLLTKDGVWEPQTEENYHDDSLIERTHMSQDEAFDVARNFLATPIEEKDG